ncbi:MAG: L-2-amino-thiazoline-4-carboxylic acid hydrolase [Bacillota bacterium]|nr:L-2-amino-thiazoline-4-carboxylic acid hydrolase [Bacillota bacterium]
MKGNFDMTSIKSSEDPASRFAKLTAELYYFLAEVLIEDLGEEKGKAAIRQALKKFGEKRVSDMKKEAKERALPLESPQTYFAVRDMPSNGWENAPGNPMTITECPMFDIWENFGEKGMDLGALYCEIDHILFGGFGLALSRPQCKTNGDRVCDFQLQMKEGQNSDGDK